ncbi:hypothetical protein D9M71_131550 [compost metagenome]
MPRFNLSHRGLLACLIAASLAHPATAAEQPAVASSFTASQNAAVLQQLPSTDRTDYESVTRGLVAPFKGQVKDANDKVIWDIDAYRFLDKDQAPDSVNPSLWRMAQLSAHAGLFKVGPRIYQVRGDVHPAQLADLGWRAHPHPAGRPARHVCLPQRPHPAPAQPGPDADGDRAEHADPARGAGEEVVHPWLLRLAEPQRAGGVPALHGLLRRQPGQPQPVAAGRERPALCRGHGRWRGGAGQGACGNGQG